MRLSDFIEESRKAGTRRSLVELMERAAGDVGFDRFAYCALTGHDRYYTSGNPAPAVAHNFPGDWTRHYFEHSYQKIDPVVLLAPGIERPFLWDALEKTYKLNRKQKILMRRAAEAGLRDGVGVPLHGPRGSVCLVTFAAGDGHPDPAAELGTLDVLASQFHTAFSTIGRIKRDHADAPVLSIRERDCLQWSARGKSSWDISKLLDISENTVNFHFKSALRKLDANSRILAVAKAIRYGLIDP